MRRLLSVCLVLLSCAHGPRPASLASLDSVVHADGRPVEDRALDAGRKPLEFLAFTKVGEGMKVAELMAGGGYTTELLSRVVGEKGVVYGHNPKFVLEKFAEKPWSERLARLPNVKRLDREFDDPFPQELAGSLDLVVSNAVYHDAVWLQADRTRMNRVIYRALKFGGRYVVCDSSAAKGRGVEDAQALHRIEENVVGMEATLAGFTLEASGDFLRNPRDTRDWNASPVAAGDQRGTSDRFCLRFVKPVVIY